MEHEEQAVWCTSCGVSTPGGVTFCPHCGARQPATEIVSSTTARATGEPRAILDLGLPDSRALAGSPFPATDAARRPEFDAALLPTSGDSSTATKIGGTSIVLPRLTATILITLFFGLFGLIPAAIGASRSRRAGQPEGRYWVAFGATLAGSFALYAAAVVGLIAVLSTAGASGPVWAKAPVVGNCYSGGDRATQADEAAGGVGFPANLWPVECTSATAYYVVSGRVDALPRRQASLDACQERFGTDAAAIWYDGDGHEIPNLGHIVAPEDVSDAGPDDLGTLVCLK